MQGAGVTDPIISGVQTASREQPAALIPRRRRNRVLLFTKVCVLQNPSADARAFRVRGEPVAVASGGLDPANQRRDCRFVVCKGLRPSKCWCFTMTTSNPPNVSTAAERMRRHRQRRHDGLRCLRIELRKTEIEELVRRNFLTPEARNDRNTVLRGF